MRARSDHEFSLPPFFTHPSLAVSCEAVVVIRVASVQTTTGKRLLQKTNVPQTPPKFVNVKKLNRHATHQTQTTGISGADQILGRDVACRTRVAGQAKDHACSRFIGRKTSTRVPPPFLLSSPEADRPTSPSRRRCRRQSQERRRTASPAAVPPSPRKQSTRRTGTR